jgi:branched-chain amino acid transport system ATP-binding protein
MLTVDSVSAYYGSAQALFDVSFDLEEGEALGIIGPNGAGKTTLLDCITGHKNYEGTIEFLGQSIEDMEPWELSESIGYVTEERNLFLDMSVHQNLTMGAYSNRDAMDENLDRVHDLFPRLAERREQAARTMSGGEQQMLAIGRGLMNDPEILILDEPSLGLAATIIKDLGEAIAEIKGQGLTVLIAEQNITFALDHAEELLLLDRGVIEHRGTSEELAERSQIEESYFG